MQGRTEKSVINVTSALIGQLMAIVVGFLARMVFVKCLGDAYLGINSLCTSIVGLLSLAELGIGESINYKLYKPLAENDIDKLKSLMRLYRNVYVIIGFVIIFIGFCILPFFHVFMKVSEIQSVQHLYLIFSLFVINSAVSYFFSYKRALIISDQKRYIVTIYHYAFYCIMNVAQIVILIKTNNFILYLLVMIICTIGQNVIISHRANKLYPFLSEKNVKKLDRLDVSEIKKNTWALLCHKVGSQVVNSTDNILVSKIIGIVTVGVYSNYLLVTTAINTIVAQLFSAVTASVGNLGATEKNEKSEVVFNRMLFGNYVFVIIVCSAFFSSIDILIAQMFGEQRVLENNVLLCIVINLFFYNIRRATWTFRDGFGLFWYDRYKSIVEAVINLVVSIFLGIRLGLVGILIGTIVSTILTSLWIEPYVLYKYAFKKSPIQYFISLFKYCVLAILICVICKYLVGSLQLCGYSGFFIGCCISIFVCLVFVVLFFGKTDEFACYLHLLKKITSFHCF